MSEPWHRDGAWHWSETVEGVELRFNRYDDSGTLQIIPPDEMGRGYAFVWPGRPLQWLGRRGRQKREQRAALGVLRAYQRRLASPGATCPKVFDDAATSPDAH